MRRTKKILSVILAALMLASVFAVPAFAADTKNSPTGDDYVIWYLSGTTIYISGHGPMPDYTRSGVGTPEWKECRDSVERVVIGDGITSIGQNAFYNFNKLSEVDIPDTVTDINDSAFENCVSIKTLTIPKGVKNIRPTAFDYTFIKEFFVPENNPVFYHIDGNLYTSDSNGNVLFKYANGKTESSFTIPSTVNGIYEGAINYSNLKTINIPAAVDFLDDYAIWNNLLLNVVNVDSGNTYFYSENGVLFERNYYGKGLALLLYPSAKAGKNYTVPSGVEIIGEDSFAYCENLQSITLSNSVWLLDYYAFAECRNLKTVDLAKVKEIQPGAFYGTAVTSIYLPKTITEMAYCSLGEDYAGNPIEGFKAYYVKGTSAASVIEQYCKDMGIKAVAMTIPSASLNAGGTKTLKPAAGTVKSWATSKKAVATVASGKVTALKKGSSTITATLSDGAKITSKITVKTSPKLSKSSVTVNKGKTTTVKITGKASTVKNVYTNTKIAKITSKNTATKLTVKGLKKGTTTLKVKVNGVTLKLKVKVK